MTTIDNTKESLEQMFLCIHAILLIFCRYHLSKTFGYYVALSDFGKKSRGKSYSLQTAFSTDSDYADGHNVVVLSLSLRPSPSSAPSNGCMVPCQTPLPRRLTLWPALAIVASNSQPVAREQIRDTDCSSLPYSVVQSTPPPSAVVPSRYTISRRFDVHPVAEDIVLGRAHAD